MYAACLILFLKLQAATAAKVTAVTAMAISGAMILYSIVSFFTPTLGSELLLGLVGVFVFYESYELWTAVKTNNLDNHPIFGRQAYKAEGGSSGAAQEQGGEAVPAQTDEAVMA